MDVTPEHEHRSNMSRNELAAEGMTRPTSAYGYAAPGQHGANGHSAGRADVVVNDPAAVQQPLQSPFGSHQAEVRDESEIIENLNQVARKTPRDRWRDAGKKIAEKGTIRFEADNTHAPAEPSANDTAHKDTPPASALERKPSGLLGRSSLGPRISSSLNLTKLGKSFNDNKAGNQAFAETVRLAQEQQQANRQSAAPVLKAVPSTKVLDCGLPRLPSTAYYPRVRLANLFPLSACIVQEFAAMSSCQESMYLHSCIFQVVCQNCQCTPLCMMQKNPMFVQCSSAKHLDFCPSLQVMTAKKRQKVEAGLVIPAFIIHPYDFQ